jgi:hypothetical protein
LEWKAHRSSELKTPRYTIIPVGLGIILEYILTGRAKDPYSPWPRLLDQPQLCE